MVNNFNLIIPLLNFESKDDFYYLQILQRKKENEEIGSNSHVVRNYYIKSIDYLVKHEKEIITLCNVFNARAMLRLNKRSFEKTAYKCMINLANTMSNKEFAFCNKSYDKATGQGHNETKPYWIIDIDEPQVSPLMMAYIELKCEPEGKKLVCIIPSKNGNHLITHPFNVKTFNDKYPSIEIHKDNPTNLYIH
jgi:hypothetical protein